MNEDEYTQLLQAELDAWNALRGQRLGGHYDVQAFTAWLALSRRSSAARHKTIDRLMQEDPGLATREN